MVVEQPRDARYRMRYDDQRRVFYETEVPSLLFDKRFPGVYGWVQGLGDPPGNHCDIFLLSDVPYKPGDVAEAYISGVLLRSDHDHKLVALDRAWAGQLRQWDFAALPEDLRNAVMRLYPILRGGERWEGVPDAASLLDSIRGKRFVPNAD